MKKVTIVNILFLTTIILLGWPTWVLAQETCNYLVWEDEFYVEGGPELTKWGYDAGGGGWGNNELQTYTSNRNNSYVKDGKLYIKALKKEGTWTSARLVTKGKGDWLYGRIEVKAKLPSGVGTWPAIWMLPTDWAYGGWPKSGEIDIMEHVGYDFGKVHGTIHTEAYNHSIGTQLGDVVEVQNVASEFHVYAIDWTEEAIIWYVDGNEYFRVENPHKTYKEWPFDKRFHLLLNIAIGGTWGGAQGVDPNLDEATMEIDYVRIYKKKIPTPVIEGKKNVNPNEELIFSTAEIQGVKYNWTFPEGVEVIDGNESAEVTVKWGNSSGEVQLELQSDCDTVTAVPFAVSTIYLPSGDSFEVPFFDDQNNILWLVAPGSSNQMELSGTTSLIADYNIAEPTENPSILYEFQTPVDLTTFNKLEIILKTSEPEPGSFRIDLIDVNGNVNLNDLFKINSLENDGEFHTYSYEFGQNPDGVYNLALIKTIKIYINYGLFGKKGSGHVEIQSVTLKSIPTGITQQREISGIRVWPNPFINYLNFNSDETVVQIEVANINGELVYIQKERNSGHFQIHPDVHPGFYFIKAKFENGDIQNLAVIKQN